MIIKDNYWKLPGGVAVLLVEDNESDYILFKEALQDINPRHRLTYSKDAEAIDRLIDNVNPDIVFLDINMPKVNGITVLQQLKADKKYRSVPVIMVSGVANPIQVEESYRAGAHHYMVKPYIYTDLMDIVRKLLETDWTVRERLPLHEGYLIVKKGF